MDAGKGPDLPTGTITFLFTDIEGSTRLLDALGDRYPSVLETHQRILRDVFRARDGIDVSTEGDSFLVVFRSAPQAVAAAVEAQRAIATHEWPEEAAVRVRMGIHTGEGVLGGDNYVGVDLHRAARIAAAGHGGQIVVSEATRALVEPVAPEGVTFRDLGEHRLRDLPNTERLAQALAEGLTAEFPALRSMDARPNNLPVQLTSFVGRRRELDEVKEAVRGTRLLTLTGPGGTGKTRLALQAAVELLPELQDGAYFVALAPIGDPALVISTVAETLGLAEQSERPPLETLIEHLAGKETLLLLDNFEQITEAAIEVGQLLTMTERVRVLVTSREPLGLSGEREYPVPPLALPDVAHLPSLEALSQYEAVRLLVDRATAVQPGFAVTNENAPAVAEICSRLDGLPLAIELAAARVKILSPQAILARLEDRLRFLSGGSRDVPARQRTLRDAIAWSYELLDEAEARLFARLATFVRGFSLESAEAVCDPDRDLGVDMLEGVASLANKSLIRQMDTGPDEPRFFMLQTIREYAEERLADSPDAEVMEQRHGEHFLTMAEDAAPRLFGPQQAELLDLLTKEHDNLRAAIDRAVARGERAKALRLSAALWRFWQMRGHLREGRERLEGLLSGPEAGVDRSVLAGALEALGGIRYWMGDMPAAREAYLRCLDIRRDLGETTGLAEALYNAGFTFSSRLSPEPDVPTGIRMLEEAQGVFRELGDEGGVARTSWGLGNLVYEEGRYDEAERLFTGALAIHQRLGDPFGMAWDHFEIGVTVQRVGRYEEAEHHAKEALRLLARAEDTSGIPLVLGGLSATATLTGRGERAATLFAAAQALETASGAGLTRLNEEWEGWGDETHWNLSTEEVVRAKERGARLSVEEAVAYGLEGEADPATE
jgi:predicted ATPase/class 3 adenylate cyclase